MSLSALSNGIAGALETYVGFVNSAIDAQTGADATANVINPDVFYTTQLLETIRDAAESYQYFKYATPMPIEGKANKLTVRRWAPLQAHTVPLEEGVPPISDKGSVEKYEMTAYQYGRYMEFTDQVDFKVVDPVVAHYSNEYSIVAVETLDLLAQDMLLTCAQQFFAGVNTTQKDVTMDTGAPSIADLRLIGLAFKKAKVKPHDTTFHVLVSPEFVYDMLDDPFVQNYMRINQNTGSYYEDGALVPMFGFSFHEVNNCPTSSVWYDSTDGYCCLAYKDYEASDAVANSFTNNVKIIKVGDANGKKTIAAVKSSGLVSGYVKDSRTGKDASYIPNQRVFEPGTGWTIMKQNHIIILGKDALARTGLSGEDSAKMYVKPLGSAGVLDPIDQRQSIGFKINSVGFGSTRLEAIVDYICVPSQLNI